MAAALLLAGCAVLRPRPADLGRLLLPPGEAGFRGRLVQSLQLRRGGRTAEGMAVLELSGEDVRLAATGPLGNVLLRLRWDGSALEQERGEGLPEGLPGEAILRDIMLAYWPTDSLRRALPGPDWELRAEAGKRTLLHRGKPWLEIEGGGEDRRSPVRLRHLEPDYEIQVETLELDEDE